MSAPPTETEIKFLLDPGACADMAKHPIFAHAARTLSPRRELTTYFDTDQCILRRHGYSLRIREKNGLHLQTLKKSPAGAGLVQRRNEWEWKLSANRLALRPLGKVLDARSNLNGELRRVRSKFVTEIHRQSFDIKLGGAQIEAVIDEGFVLAGDRQEPVRELELEIKQGPSGPAYRLALDLLEHYPLLLGAESKADRGYRLLTGSDSSSVKSRAAPLPHRAALKEALTATAQAALHGFVANIPAARAGNPEGVHQMRVALRRLRTMLVLYAPCLERCARERFNNAIRDLGAVLGTARDWDVFVEETLPAARNSGVRAEWIAALEERAAEKRESAHHGVRDLIGSKAPAELVLGIQAWLSDFDWAADQAQAARSAAAEIMPGFLDRVAAKVMRRGRAAARLSPRALHPLRKSIKKLRYSAEAVREFYDEKRVKRHVKRCKKIQTVLGTINDAQMTVRLVREIAPRHSAAWAPPAGGLMKWNTERREHASAKLGKVWRALKHAKPFWK